MCISLCPVLQFEEPLCDYCSTQSPSLFICLYECVLSTLLPLYALMVCTLFLTEKRDD